MPPIGSADCGRRRSPRCRSRAVPARPRPASPGCGWRWPRPPQRWASSRARRTCATGVALATKLGGEIAPAGEGAELVHLGDVGEGCRYDADRPSGRRHAGRPRVRLHALSAVQARAHRARGLPAETQARGRRPRRRAGELRFPRREEHGRRQDAHGYAHQRPRRSRLCVMLPGSGVGHTRLIHRSLLRLIPRSVDECDGRMTFSLSLGVPGEDRDSVGAERERRTPQLVRPERSSGSAGSPPSPTAARSAPAIARRKRAGAARRRIPADPARCRAPRTAR